MAVYAPGDDPPPPNAIDPGMWARLMGYVGGLNPIGSANAAEAPQGPGPGYDPNHPGAGHPEAGHPTNAAGQPLYAFPHIREALAGGPGNTNIPGILPHLTGDGPNVQGRPILPYTNPNTRDLAGAAAIPTDLPPAGPAAPATRPSGIGSDANFPVMGAGGFPTTYAPPGQQPAMPTPVPPGVSPATTVASAPLPPPRPAAPIDPRMRGEVPPVPSPWITSAFDRPNMNPGLGGGMMGGALAANQSGRGGGGPSQMGMLDLSHLFGGGQPAAATAAAAPALPRTKIDVGKIPANARAEVPPVKRSKAPWGYGPYQKGKGTGPFTQY